MNVRLRIYKTVLLFKFRRYLWVYWSSCLVFLFLSFYCCCCFKGSLLYLFIFYWLTHWLIDFCIHSLIITRVFMNLIVTCWFHLFFLRIRLNFSCAITAISDHVSLLLGMFRKWMKNNRNIKTSWRHGRRKQRQLKIKYA